MLPTSSGGRGAVLQSEVRSIDGAVAGAVSGRSSARVTTGNGRRGPASAVEISLVTPRVEVLPGAHTPTTSTPGAAAGPFPATPRQFWREPETEPGARVAWALPHRQFASVAGVEGAPPARGGGESELYPVLSDGAQAPEVGRLAPARGLNGGGSRDSVTEVSQVTGGRGVARVPGDATIAHSENENARGGDALARMQQEAEKAKGVLVRAAAAAKGAGSGGEAPGGGVGARFSIKEKYEQYLREREPASSLQQRCAGAAAGQEARRSDRPVTRARADCDAAADAEAGGDTSVTVEAVAQAVPAAQHRREAGGAGQEAWRSDGPVTRVHLQHPARVAAATGPLVVQGGTANTAHAGSSGAARTPAFPAKMRAGVGWPPPEALAASEGGQRSPAEVYVWICTCMFTSTSISRYIYIDTCMRC